MKVYRVTGATSWRQRGEIGKCHPAHARELTGIGAAGVPDQPAIS
jgi:hypothetical protein